MITELDAYNLGMEIGQLTETTFARTRRPLDKMTCKELDAELRRLKIKGRSKARRKADKVAMLKGLA